MNYLSQCIKLWLVGALMCVHAAPVQITPPAIDNEFLASFINDIKHSGDLPSGTTIAVVQGDKLIYRGDFGYRDIAQKLPVNQDTRFYIASATKPFSALNFLLDARQEPKLEKVTLAEMFPQFPLMQRNNISPQQLLTHTASINNFPLVLATAYIGEHTPQTLQRLVKEHSSTSSEPVGEFKYTNVGYNIYSVYADRVFQKTWQDKLQQQVFAPAGMANTTAIRTAISNQSNIARSYSLTRLHRRDPLYLEKTDMTLHAAGGIYSTSDDLAKFLIAQLNSGVIHNKQVFPAQVIARSHVQQASTDKSYGDFIRDGYAWGWYTGDYKNQPMLHHFGGFAGIHSHISFMPEAKIGLVVLNAEDFLSARLTGIIADYVYGALLAEPDIKSKVQKSVIQLKDKLASVDRMVEKENNKISSRAWQLSLPTKEYEGQYKHPLLGTIKITINEENRFHVALGVMHSHSTGMDKQDMIRVTLDPTSGSVIKFNCSDKVESLSYGGLEFTRVR